MGKDNSAVADPLQDEIDAIFHAPAVNPDDRMVKCASIQSSLEGSKGLVFVHSNAIESECASFSGKSMGQACRYAVAFIEDKGLKWPEELADMKNEMNRLAEGDLELPA